MPLISPDAASRPLPSAITTWCYHVKCVRRLTLLPKLLGVGVVVLMADGKGLDAASGEIKGMQSKDEGAMEAGAEPEQNGSCKVDTSAFLRP